MVAVSCDDDSKDSPSNNGSDSGSGGSGGSSTWVPYGTPEHQNPSTSEYRYTNPVLYANCPDPSICRSPEGKYYLYATAYNLYMYSSDDLVNWTYEGTVFTDATRPTSNYLWAPDMNYVDGHYLFYYTVDTNSSTTRYINVMTADNPTGPFTPQGTVIDPSFGVVNSIDQCYWEEEDGSKWMFWGSFNGIYAVQLSDDGLTVPDPSSKVLVAGWDIEGTMIYKRDGYYYLIGSAGSYDGGASSTYNLVMCRSTNLLGPYKDKDGNFSDDKGGKSQFLVASDRVYGPGHCSEFLDMPDGSTWLMYHGWPYDNPNYGRVDNLSQVFWENTGWPYIMKGQPSETWDYPPVNGYSFTYSPVDYMEFMGSNTSNRYFYDTGYVPDSNTKVEMKIMVYPNNYTGVTTSGSTRRIFQANTSSSTGFSLYVNSNGKNFGFANYGSNDNSIADLEGGVDYEITATLGTLTINGESYNQTAGSTSGKWERITLFSGTYDYPFIGRIYYFKIYDGNELVKDFEPVLRNEDSLVMFHETVSDTYYLPFDTDGFAYGDIVD